MIVGGDPALGPASLSRFVLPFAYRRSPWPSGESSSPPAVYRRLGRQELDPEVERRHYLSRETAQVLFERARWHQLERPDGTPVRTEFVCAHRSSGREFLVRIEPPRVVLFEWPAGREASTQDDLLATGFLVLDTTFPNRDLAPGFDDLLAFNEVFRTWRRPFAEHDEVRGYCRLLGRCPLDLVTGGPSIGDAPGLGLDLYFDRWQSLLEAPLQLPEAEAPSRGPRLAALFPTEWGDRARRWREDPLADDTAGWVIYADYRAFVWTCALVHGGAHALVGEGRDGGSPSWADGRWIKLLNVDAPAERPADTASSTAFERDWAKERTYQRWAEHGSLYGFTYHSGAMLGPPTAEPPIDRHFREVYFDQTLLLLYLRVSSFRFSRELTRITADLRDPRSGPRDFERRFRALRRSFAFFTNLYEFPLVSNQEQGIELYALAREHLDVSEFFDEIGDEVKSAHEYAEMVQNQRQARVVLVLTLVAAVGVPVTVAASLFGLDFLVDAVLPGQPDWWLSRAFVGVACFLVLVTWLTIRFASRWSRRMERFLLGSAHSERGED